MGEYDTETLAEELADALDYLVDMARGHDYVEIAKLSAAEDAVREAVAARIVQARAGEGALRERVEAAVSQLQRMAVALDHPNEDPATQARGRFLAFCVDRIRAALTDTAGDPT